MVVIVQYFYSYQFQKLSAVAGVNAVTSATRFLLSTGLQNFVIDAFNERCEQKDAARVEQIHALAAASDPPRKLLVGSSCGGGGTPAPEVVSASDFVLIHGNGQKPAGITKLIGEVRATEAWKAEPKPIVFNEDDHGNLLSRDPAGSNLEAALAANVSWGFLCCCDGKVQGDYSTGYQCPPVDWRISGGGQCLSGSRGSPMNNGSKVDWGSALRRITASAPRRVSLKTSDEAANKNQPHFVFVLADDLGWNDIGFHDARVHTPTLDRLAAEGVQLERHYVYRYCSPTRGSFLSGRLPHHDHQSNPGGESAFGPNLNMTLLPAKLKQVCRRPAPCPPPANSTRSFYFWSN